MLKSAKLFLILLIVNISTIRASQFISGKFISGEGDPVFAARKTDSPAWTKPSVFTNPKLVAKAWRKYEEAVLHETLSPAAFVKSLVNMAALQRLMFTMGSGRPEWSHVKMGLANGFSAWMDPLVERFQMSLRSVEGARQCVSPTRLEFAGELLAYPSLFRSILDNEKTHAKIVETSRRIKDCVDTRIVYYYQFLAAVPLIRVSLNALQDNQDEFR